MRHLALYRKWRPTTFGEVVGQKHISRTLLNAIEQGRLAHAYLFCGPRGTGKTTSARLLAKALNCVSPVSFEPCNECQNCIEITEGHSLDVIEIDAASNRGIEDARELREQVRFSASGGRYRVFIIDEFHMLTTEAFNALLKTLEEPPEKVVFVLATTEPHKVLQTIISRCQRFDFQRISLVDLITHLNKVAAAEEISVSPQALESLARKAAGGLRDALSLLDQVHALSRPGEELEDDLVYQTLGLIQEEILFQLLEHLFNQSLESLLTVTQHLLAKGYDANLILQDLIHLLRHLLLGHLPTDKMEVLGVPSHLSADLKSLYGQISQGQVIQLIESLSRIFDRLQKVMQPDIWLEAELSRLCLTQEKPLLRRLEILEQALKDGAFSVGSAAGPPVQMKAVTQAPTPSALPASIPTSPLISPPNSAPVSASQKRIETLTAVSSAEGRELQAPPANKVVPSNEPSTSAVVAPVNVGGPPNPTHPQGLNEAWQRFLQRVAAHAPLRPQYGFISNGKLVHIDTERQVWHIQFSTKAHCNQVEKIYLAGKLGDIISQVAGIGVSLSLELAQKEPVQKPSSSLSVAAPKPASTPPLTAPSEPLPIPTKVPTQVQAQPEKNEVPPDLLIPEVMHEEVIYNPAEVHQEGSSKKVDTRAPKETQVEKPLVPLTAVVPSTPPVTALSKKNELKEVADLFKGRVIPIK